MIIAIDGPSGAGKSTIAKLVAKSLDFSCLDTGAMFRSVAVLAGNCGVSLDDDAALGKLARENEIAFTFDANEEKTQHVFIAGEEVTDKIRTAEIDKAVSPVSAAPLVRAALLEQQRRIGNAGNFVVEGRDIGTTVFPQAEVKIFLTASPEERARRRVLQNKERGVGLTDFDAVLADIVRRDKADSTRAVSPLRQADDAYLLDSSNLGINQVVDIICERVQRAQGQ